MGIDIGGTFTDLAAIDLVSGLRSTAKVLTTPSDPTLGILDAIERAFEDSQISLADVTEFVHATTLAINTVIERNGARVGLVTTHGFTDVLEIARGNRYDLFDLQIRFHKPLVERNARVSVDERITANGEIALPLNRMSVLSAATRLQQQGVESVAICLLHSYKNPVHEQQVADGFKDFDVHVSISSDIAPIIREYERSLAAVINAYVAPKLARYLARLAQVLYERGFQGKPQIMRSDGGWFSADMASRHPVRILESGPAAGALAAAVVARACRVANAVAFDMGGTTAKACLITNGEMSLTDELEVSRLARLKRGSGLPLRLPSVDLIEIGAGGGSIASVGALGLLQVGPESSGADPGPSCYGRGGDRPTVTDADLVLGYLNPSYFAGGSILLDVAAARQAIAKEIVGHKDEDAITNAAWGIHDLVNENMARAMRLHCVEHGVHPSAVSIVATGGAGPLHAVGLMKKLGAERVIFPPNVGVASALGLLDAPRMAERTITDIVLLSELTVDEFERRFNLIAKTLGGETGEPGGALRRFVNIRLRGQGYEVRVAIPDVIASLEDVAESFAGEYARRFGRAPSGAAQPEIVDWIARFTKPRAIVTGKEIPAAPLARKPEIADTRAAFWGPTDGWLDASVYKRQALAPGQIIEGPALVEEPTSTIVIGPNRSASIDAEYNIWVQ